MTHHEGIEPKDLPPLLLLGGVFLLGYILIMVLSWVSG